MNTKEPIILKDRNNTLPNKEGEYYLWDGDQLLFSEKTHSLKDRIHNLSDTRNHKFRRHLSEKLFSQIEGYEKPTSFKKAPQHIEVLLDDYIQNKTKVSYKLLQQEGLSLL
jgi:hypothetical protein